MKSLIAAMILALAAGPAAAAEEERRGHVDVVFCIDRSGSMSAVIETAKQKVWSIVNEVAKSRPTPILRIGLIGYGSADKAIKLFPLTDDLDTVYENLMTFKTDMGGNEWVGWAIKKATEDMTWSQGEKTLKIIFMVGNETAKQGREEVLYTKTAPQAIRNDIMVNAIYCGKPNPVEEQTWREVASLADGSYTSIDLSGGAVTIQTPMDKQLMELNRKLNTTYIPFGTHGRRGLAKQKAQDKNSEKAGGQVTAASRAVAKAQSLYRNSRWDLCDAFREKKIKLEDIKEEDLPENMKKMTLEERKAYIAKMQKEREAFQKQIKELGKKRSKYIQTEIKKRNLTQDSAFDEAVRKTVRQQAEKKGFTFEEEK